MSQNLRTDFVLAVEKNHTGPALLFKGAMVATSETEAGYTQSGGAYVKYKVVKNC